jgi:tol-pal system protein YbgF
MDILAMRFARWALRQTTMKSALTTSLQPPSTPPSSPLTVSLKAYNLGAVCPLSIYVLEGLLMKSMFRAVLLGTAVFLLAGCAVTSGPAPKATPRDASAELEGLLRAQQGLTRQIGQLQDNLLLLEARMQDQQQLIDQLRTALPAQKGTVAGEKTGSPPPPAPPSAREAPGRGLASPTEIYLQAFSDYASGHYGQAILGFETFLRHFPDNDYAANAQYWLGECYLGQQLYPKAAEEFQKTVQRYPQGAKTPDALLKLASVYQQLNQPDQATAALQILRQRYPGSPAARQAEQER